MVGTLEGTTFPERPYRICAEKVAEFVAVTGDDPERWTAAAPPGFAAALLFVIAPELLADRRVRGSVIHADQSFSWSSAIPLETDVSVTGTVDRVRRRNDAAFVLFSLRATSSGDPLVEGRSTFLVGESGLDSGDVVVSPPSVDERGETATVGGTLPSPRSASRSDLIRYAGATRDWNPIHWDHDTAVAGGLGGVVVHGLLQSAWLTQTAALSGRGDRPLRSARFRYLAPLRPGMPASVHGGLDGDEIDLRLVSRGVTTVTGRFVVER